ncbi:MAG: hypothetical protein Q7S22_06805 [Candidatus Micrarchaeota archaeon]|nr:hypothetical protein [Candidatus Micrarchaeota archaeon]
MKLVIILLLVIALLLAGCTQPVKKIEEKPPVVVPEVKNETINIGLTMDEAKLIAQASLCTQNATLVDNGIYNNVTGTWWFDISPKSPGCNPACVVNEKTKTAEINGRCTGLVVPEIPDDLFTNPLEQSITDLSALEGS